MLRTFEGADKDGPTPQTSTVERSDWPSTDTFVNKANQWAYKIQYLQPGVGNEWHNEAPSQAILVKA